MTEAPHGRFGQEVNVLALLQGASPRTREDALEEEATRAMAARLERQANQREARTSGTSRKRYTAPTASGLRYTIAGHRVQSVDDVKAIIPKIVEEYGVSKSEAKRIAHKMLHADKAEVAESKRAVKQAAQVKRREFGIDHNNRIPKMPAGHKGKMRWEMRYSRTLPADTLILRTLAGNVLQDVKLVSRISKLSITPARPEAIWS